MAVVRLELLVEDPNDVVPDDPTGLTSEAYDRLYEAVTDAGFAVMYGPRLLDDLSSVTRRH